MNGTRLEDACDDCTAYAQLEQISPGVTVVKVYHDDSCPSLRDMEHKP